MPGTLPDSRHLTLTRREPFLAVRDGYCTRTSSIICAQ
jgi:hypothetical protein